MMYTSGQSRNNAASTHTIDLRSDTVTLPSPAMREAMARAELGDDVYGEDPTVNRLEAMAAELVGKEAALLVPSGTMGNLSAMLSHAPRGRRVICGDESHVYRYEAGGASALGGLIYHVLPNTPDGRLPLDQLQEALQPAYDGHESDPGVLCLENTHNRCGGTVLPPTYLATVQAMAREAGVPLHLDGARIFNAAVALNLPVDRLTQYVDTVQFCLSKGLAAPVGSLLAGPAPFIARARRIRKQLGGGMRQAGVLAAAGMIALTEMVPRLAEDHAHARLLAEGLATIPALQINLELVQSDIVRFKLVTEQMSVNAFLAGLRARGVLMSGLGGPYIRAVTHYGISADDVRQTLVAIRQTLAAA